MQPTELKYTVFTTKNQDPKNLLEFLVFDLRDIKLGLFITAIQTPADAECFTLIKKVVREIVNDFATVAKPLTATDHLEQSFASLNTKTAGKLTTADYRDLHLVLLYIQNNEMHFSVHGDIHLSLARKHRLFDVVKMTYGLSPRQYDKIFTRMYSGDIKHNDVLIVSTHETWDCLDIKKIPEIVAKLPQDGAAAFLQNFLPEHSTYKLGGMLIGIEAIASKDTIAPSKKQPSTPAESIHELIGTEDATSSLLSPSPILWLKNIKSYLTASSSGLKSSTTWLKHQFKKIQHPKQSHTNVQSRPQNPIIPINNTTVEPVLSTKSRHARIITNIRAIQSRINATISTFAHQLQQTPRRIKKIVIRLRSLPKSTIALLVVALLLLSAFGVSIYVTKQSQQNAELASFFATNVETIKVLHTQASQAIIFRDYDRARGILIDARNDIAALPASTETQTATKQELTEKNTQLTEKANRQTTITLPLTLVDLDRVFTSQPLELALGNTQLVVISPSQMVLVDINSGETTTVPISDLTPLRHIVTADPDNTSEDSVYLFYKTTGIATYAAGQNQPTTINNTIEVNNPPISAVTVFNDRLYRLDVTNNQIWRHLKPNSAFQAGSGWIELPNDFSQSTSLAVDGFVYVLDGQRGILRFDNGIATNWELEHLEPSIAAATIVRTTEDSNFLYVLDPAHNRFLVYDKDGFFRQQFNSDEFTELLDMVIRETPDSTTAYLLTAHKIFVVQFTIE